jgi:hypothetical protein
MQREIAILKIKYKKDRRNAPKDLFVDAGTCLAYITGTIPGSLMREAAASREGQDKTSRETERDKIGRNAVTG